MPEDPHGSVTHFFAQLREGDERAAERLWDRFSPRMLALARKTLRDRRPGVADEQDAVQSAFISFWRRASRGDFSSQWHRDDLWRLLATLTAQKVSKQRRRERAQKRGGGRVYPEASLAGPQGPFRLDECLDRMRADDFDVACEELLLQLDENLRAVALLRLMRYTNREIGDTLNLSVSSIERKVQLIRRIWTHAREG